MEAFIVLLIIVIAILQVILFFKVWGMTNTTKDIKSKLDEMLGLAKQTTGKQVGVYPVEWYVNNGDLEAAAGNKELAKEYYKKALYVVDKIERSKRKMEDEIRKKMNSI